MVCLWKSVLQESAPFPTVWLPKPQDISDVAADYCLNHLLGSLGYVFFLSKLNLMESQRNRLHIALLALSRASSQEEGTCAVLTLAHSLPGSALSEVTQPLSHVCCLLWLPRAQSQDLGNVLSDVRRCVHGGSRWGHQLLSPTHHQCLLFQLRVTPGSVCPAWWLLHISLLGVCS